ncbi:integron integrase, partial [Marichromatium sp. AB31]
MVRRAEQYIAAFPDRKLAEQCPADVERYLTEVGQRTEMKDWQFRQIVDAIRI